MDSASQLRRRLCMRRCRGTTSTTPAPIMLTLFLIAAGTNWLFERRTKRRAANEKAR
jgi:hypothetical protein